MNIPQQTPCNKCGHIYQTHETIGCLKCLAYAWNSGMVCKEFSMDNLTLIEVMAKDRGLI